MTTKGTALMKTITDVPTTKNIAFHSDYFLCRTAAELLLFNMIWVVATVLAISVAPPSSADSTAELASQVTASRGGCAPLRSDPVLNDVASRANNETHAYIEHTARFVPFEDPMPVLRGLGYQAGKAKLLAGYGDSDARAIHGVTVQGWQAIPDCSFTRYGANVFDDPNGGYALAALVLAGD